MSFPDSVQVNTYTGAGAHEARYDAMEAALLVRKAHFVAVAQRPEVLSRFGCHVRFQLLHFLLCVQDRLCQQHRLKREPQTTSFGASP